MHLNSNTGTYAYHSPPPYNKGTFFVFPVPVADRSNDEYGIFKRTTEKETEGNRINDISSYKKNKDSIEL
jgi:hypothetical protein